MTDQQKAISLSWKWALVAIALTAGLMLTLASRGPSPISAADPGTCDPARPHAAGDFEETITSGGVTREYILYVPPSYTGAETVPVVLNWHGLGSNAGEQQDYSELPAKADEAGFIVAAPQGLGDPASHNFTTIVPEPDSVLFTNDLLDELESQLCIDTARVFSTGLSNGAQMSTRLACNASERIAAIAPVAGWYFPPAIVQLSAEPPCSSTRPVSIIAFHGAADAVIPFDGGPGNFDLTYRDIDDEVLPEWAEHNGCAGAPAEEQAAPGVRLVRYADCDQGATVELYVVEDADGAGPGTEGGGHTWPGSTFVRQRPPETKALIGLTTHEISATDLMWEFFQAHAQPAAQEPVPTPTTSAPQPTATALSATGADDSSSNAGVLAGIIAAVAAGAIALGGGAAWYARRRHR